MEQGRDVYVVPGNINSENSIGTNELIKQGALLVSDYKDILKYGYNRKFWYIFEVVVLKELKILIFIKIHP